MMKKAPLLLIFAIVLIACYDLEQRITPGKDALLKADILSSAMRSLRYFAADLAPDRTLISEKTKVRPHSRSENGYTSHALAELPLAVEVYVEENGVRKLTDATASLYDLNTGILDTYELAAKRNNIVITGEPDISCEFIVEKEGYWPSSTYFTYDELKKNPWRSFCKIVQVRPVLS